MAGSLGGNRECGTNVCDHQTTTEGRTAEISAGGRSRSTGTGALGFSLREVLAHDVQLPHLRLKCSALEPQFHGCPFGSRDQAAAFTEHAEDMLSFSAFQSGIHDRRLIP